LVKDVFILIKAANTHW